MTTVQPVPPPGSEDAVVLGCRCPRIDNGYGRGYMGGFAKDDDGNVLYVIADACPLHAHVEEDEEEHA